MLRKTFDRLQMSNGFPWCIASVPIPSWAATVFPELPEDRAMEKLWDAILRSVRIQGDGTAVSAWRQHLEPVKGLAEHGTGLLRPDQPVGVHALQRFRIAGGNGQIGGSHFRIAGEKLFAPLRRVIENGGVRPEELLPAEIVVTPVHDDLPAACVIGRVSTQPGEGGALHRR